MVKHLRVQTGTQEKNSTSNRDSQELQQYWELNRDVWRRCSLLSRSRKPKLLQVWPSLPSVPQGKPYHFLLANGGIWSVMILFCFVLFCFVFSLPFVVHRLVKPGRVFLSLSPVFLHFWSFVLQISIPSGYSTFTRATFHYLLLHWCQLCVCVCVCVLCLLCECAF